MEEQEFMTEDIENVDAEIIDDSDGESEDSKGFPVGAAIAGLGLTALAAVAVAKRKQIKAAVEDFQLKAAEKKAERAAKKAADYKQKMILIQSRKENDSEEDSE